MATEARKMIMERVCSSLSTMLKATSAGEASLPEGERLSAVMPEAEEANKAALMLWVVIDDDDPDTGGGMPPQTEALGAMIAATHGGVINHKTIARARYRAEAALKAWAGAA